MCFCGSSPGTVQFGSSGLEGRIAVFRPKSEVDFSCC